MSYRRPYPARTRLRAVRLARRSSCRHAARLLSIPYQTILRWEQRASFTEARWRCECSPLSLQIGPRCQRCHQPSTLLQETAP